MLFRSPTPNLRRHPALSVRHPGLGTWQVERLHWKEGLIAERNAALPQAQTLTELGIGDTVTLLWHGVVGPKALPADRTALLEKVFVQAAKTDRFRQFMESKGIKVEAAGGAEFRKLIDAEHAAMGQVMKAIGLAK